MPTKKLFFASPRILSELYANHPYNLEKIEKTLGSKIVSRDNWVDITASEEIIAKVTALFDGLEEARSQGMVIRDIDFDHFLSAAQEGTASELSELFKKPLTLTIAHKRVLPKTPNQKRYIQIMQENDVVFGIGPAGTGKTYLAVAMALQALLSSAVEKIILTRPAVESGEALGFLPGDLEEKILPYLRPLYDAMEDMIGRDQMNKLIEKRAVEIAPLAYMRGRTLSRAFVILDEAQNTTHEQMMMFLTRLGENSRMVITGDITQTDLPFHKSSGLKEAIHALRDIPGISFFYFEGIDVVRHSLVQRIIEAYDRFLSGKPSLLESPGGSSASEIQKKI